ncbi:MAG TPA: bifunctional diaminohydroxyphosphoribosylaminopyrimidine deaminase/5-amino-6-(5-phosphoribosylamino)uracil reductase RibD [Candidatus Baltobacteraceae bacterium]|nr:bifunctional diaminohydroxyphosphoribosylaminopyrimidine deaminase/5-amino-6-(5-phosphoribosylamino)uracil reductase RibD [Candidatus Baltobacteraceae bacterium]
MNAQDRLYLDRAYELARRATGNTSPNPAVGAVVVIGEQIVGEGYHHRAGEPHAEVLALQEAGAAAKGATLYVSLEPCNHHGRTPPCSIAVAQAGIARVVAGAADPNPKTDGGGVKYLRDRGIAVEVADDPEALEIIEPFARAIRCDRPFVSLKMAMSLDGYVASKPGRQEWLTGEESRSFVRDLRIAHDAVAVGAGTVRIDNPQLTVRPPHHRLREYVRAVFCETDTVDPQSAVFTAVDGYAKTLVFAPAGLRERFAPLVRSADVIFVGDESATHLDIPQAFRLLRSRGVTSVLCEGGPTMAGNLLNLGLVDRFYWLVAPRVLRTPDAVPVVTSGTLGGARGIRFDRVERLGADLLISGTIDSNV